MAYRKEGKQEAYEYLLVAASKLPDNRINSRYGHIQLHTHDLKAATWSKFYIAGKDFDDVCAKALRVERGRRLGETRTTKMSIDLNAPTRGMLAELQAELGHATEVATIRAAIHKLYVATFA